jgi:hypothetical protein
MDAHEWQPSLTPRMLYSTIEHLSNENRAVFP